MPSRAQGFVIAWKGKPEAALTTSQEQRDAPVQIAGEALSRETSSAQPENCIESETDAPPTTSQERWERPYFQNRVLSRARGFVIFQKGKPVRVPTTSQERRGARVQIANEALSRETSSAQPERRWKRETDAPPTTSQERWERPYFKNRVLSRAHGLVSVWKMNPTPASGRTRRKPP